MANDKSTESAEEIRKVLSAESIMFELWERAAPSLSKEELEWFSNASEHADTLTQDLQEVLEGIGCLVNDNDKPVSFQSSGSVATLLFNISRQLETVSGLIHVGDSASSRLLYPERYE